MDLQQRINAFAALGRFLHTCSKAWPTSNEKTEGVDPLVGQMVAALEKANHGNGWFTEDNLQFALQSWSNALTISALERWTANYSIPDVQQPKTIAIVMAGNIPLVGLHDMLSVLLTGNKVLAKLSSNDTYLLPAIAKFLIAQQPDWKNYISFTKDPLDNFDAVIATGSNNTSRYFEYYFNSYPHIIRRNRNSVAVLTGEETPQQLEALADDVFRYFGLGCRNVSKIYIPEGYSFDAFFKAMYSWRDIIHNHKYINNYDYNKAVYLMGNISLLDNEFLLLKEDTGFSSPIAVLFYERYSNLSQVKMRLKDQQDNIQAIVSQAEIDGAVDFGLVQAPELWDYADGVDTMSFLLTLPE
jgi:hypothetical protein